MSPSRETTAKDGVKTFIYILLYLSAILLGAYFTKALPRSIGSCIWLGIVLIGLFVLVRWHVRTFAYRCGKCGSYFEISTLVDFISPHSPVKGGGVKLLKCPDCRRWSWARVIKKLPG